MVERFSFTSPPPLISYLSLHFKVFFKVPVTDDVTTLKISTAVKITEKQMRWWWSGPSGGRRRAVEGVRGGVSWQERRENGA